MRGVGSPAAVISRRYSRSSQLYPPMHERLVEPSVAEPRVERHRESLATLGASEIDEGPGAAEHSNAIDHRTVNTFEHGGGVDAVPDPLDIAATQDRDVERWPQAEAVEPVEGRSSRTARPHLATDVEHQREQLGAVIGGSTGESERVRADLEEGTARDPAPKLCVGHANAVRLPP